MTTARRTFAWIFVAIAILFAPNAALATGPVYTAIVDAGSGGTRLFFYKVTKAPYPELKLLFKQVVDDIPDASYQPDDGIDNYACPPGDDPAAQAFYATKNVNPNVMFPLWNGLKAELSAMAPAVNPADVIVKVFATAGMRTASEVCGKAAVQDLYAVIRAGMTEKGLTNAANEARTINGAKEEGLWTFINTNDEYANAFERPNHPKPRAPAVGTLEVGGSSIQIVYPIGGGSTDPKAINFKINNRSMTVHADSILHLGQDDMRKALRDARDTSGKLMAYKCWATGFDHLNDVKDEGHKGLSQDGAFTPSKCQAFMRSYIAQYMPKPLDLTGVTAKFVGLGGVKYTLDAFGLVADPYSGGNNFNSTVKTRCTADITTWTSINTNENVQRACPHGAYIATLLSDPTLGLFRQNRQRFERALVPADVNGAALSWVVGYLLLTYSK